TVWEPENGKGTDISTDKKFKDKSGLDKTDDTEFYEDFGHEGHFSSDYRLEFKVRFVNADAKADFEKDYETGKIEDSMDVVTGKTLEFTKVIRAEDEISEEQLNIMKGIFSMADEEDADDWDVRGEVYAGTRSVDGKDNRYDDLSDTISYRTFYNDYINDQAWDQSIEKSENGEWLKIVDNDGDGKADYAFLTHYYLDEATGTYTKGGDTYTEYNTLNVERFEDDDGIVKYVDEIAVGDVVLYTIIDNKICIQKAQVLTDKVNSVSFRDETITTVGGETKGQSGIYNRTDMDEVIVEMDEDVEYNMYLDRYGYVRAYELAQGTKYALLTELYWTRGSNVQYVTNRDLRAEVKAADAKIDEFDVLNDKDNDFDMEEVLGGTYNNWGQLTTAKFPNTLYADINDDVDRNIVLQPATAHLSLDEEDGDEFFNPALTNVARYVMTDDGVRISSAAEYAETTKNEQLYYANYKADGTEKTGNDRADINKDGRYNTGDKVTVDTWKAWYKENVDKDATSSQLDSAWKAADLQKVYDIDYIELDSTKNIAEDARRYDIADDDEQVRS
ncbi:MAG: hypothetical protein HFF79_09150, partial [Oscillospiraceae bacterium]|nr:hypothetical protein [Oscillospiraceae bacterium]